MDGELNPLLSPGSDSVDAVARERVGGGGPWGDKAKTIRWFLIVGVLLALVLGGFYGFNRYRAQSIATFFANNKPPPAQIAAVTATSEAVPHFATGIGSPPPVHQVTITPEIGGRGPADPVEPGAAGQTPGPPVPLNHHPPRGDPPHLPHTPPRPAASP